MVNSDERVGEISINKFGTEFKIIEYVSSHKILIETTDIYHYRKWTNYRDFKLGAVKSPYDKTVYSVGFLGDGQYKASNNNIKEISYVTWHDMIGRCYNSKTNNKRPKYKACAVSDKWHNYQEFAKWWNDNYYGCNNERMCLDKDILIKNNTIYSEDTCLIVPSRINTLIENCTASRGNLPLGVSFDKNMNLFKSTSRIITNGKSQKIHLGFYSTPEAAFYAYKIYKENYIKSVAKEYRAALPEKVYNALCNYEISIID